jgi:hypothetical protein
MQHHLTLEVEDGVTGVVLARGHYGMVRPQSFLDIIYIHRYLSNRLKKLVTHHHGMVRLQSL